MKIGERDASVLLSDEGREVLKASGPGFRRIAILENSDDIGIWIRVNREDGDHLVLIRWEYVLSMDFAVGQPKTLGLR
jgi:hypothetical protein